MDAFTEGQRLRERAWHHFEMGNFDTAALLMGRAREVESGTVPATATEVVL